MAEYRHIIETPELTVASEYEPSQDNSVVLMTEEQLENQFVAQLSEQGYEPLSAGNAEELRQNLRRQLERLNGLEFTEGEWKRFYEEELANPNRGIVEKTELLQRGSAKIGFTRDDGSIRNVMLLDKETLPANRLQVMRQHVVSGGAHKNRYDVTILVNGLPIVQVELKKPGGAIREAFNQIERYQRDSFWAEGGLYQYLQLFVISTGIETRYYSNTTRERAESENQTANKGTKKRSSASFEFTSCWADARNKRIRNIFDFARTFFAKNTLLNVLTKFCVFTDEKTLMVMRPYQIAATERIIQKIRTAVNYKQWSGTEGGGFIWHTTGSGKTLTSFKTAQLASTLPDVDKVLFVVDRKDLDYQTIREYDRFEKGAANGSRNTATLKRQLEDVDAHGLRHEYPIIVTTIQKLQCFIKKADKNSPVFQKRFVFIFDECHRSQFGDMHKAISRTFKKRLLFGFTGTPIFKENARTIDGKLATTEQAFGSAADLDRTTGERRSSALHVYNIIDAINDGNVLKFHVDYVSTVREKNGSGDYQVNRIDTKEAIQAPERIANVVRYILEHYDQKTLRNAQSYPFKVVKDPERVAKKPDAPAETVTRSYRGFNSMFAVDSIESLMLYYPEFKKQLGARFGRDFRIATIFSYSPNTNKTNPNEEFEEEPEGTIGEENSDDAGALPEAQRRFLDEAIGDYNEVFHTSYSVEGESFANYYKDVSQRVKNREVELLLVVNMFLTGFDAPALNTLWVDKNLQYHGLIQAFSRTNRILNATKSQGNIVCFRDLSQSLDEALALFGNKDASGLVLQRSWKDYTQGYVDASGAWRPGYYALVDAFTERFTPGEETLGERRQAAFVKDFSELLKLRNILQAFDEFEGNDRFGEHEFQAYTAEYLRLRDEIRGAKGAGKGPAASILDDLVFETELVAQVDVNIDYILRLVREYASKQKRSLIRDARLPEEIERVVDSSPTLRSKKALVERFVAKMTPDADVNAQWTAFIAEERRRDFELLVAEEKLNPDRAREFLRNAFRNAQLGDDPEAAVTGSGADLDALLPKRSYFSKGADGLSRVELKDRVVRKLRAFFDKFCGLLAPEE